MQRAGGYTPYFSAYQRLRLESSRPLDAADGTQFKPGVHSVRVEYEERKYTRIHFDLVGAAGRRIRWSMPRNENFRGIKPGDELRVRIELTGDAELRVCTDGSLLLVDPDGGVHDVSSVEDAKQLCAHWRVEIKRPQVVGFA